MPKKKPFDLSPYLTAAEIKELKRRGKRDGHTAEEFAAQGIRRHVLTQPWHDLAEFSLRFMPEWYERLIEYSLWPSAVLRRILYEGLVELGAKLEPPEELRNQPREELPGRKNLEDGVMFQFKLPRPHHEAFQKLVKKGTRSDWLKRRLQTEIDPNGELPALGSRRYKRPQP